MALSDAKMIDAQAGRRNLRFGAAGGAGGGRRGLRARFLDYLLVFSLEKLVLDNEICGQVRHFLKEK
jgi:trimethylamine:corrinoid methyltransferase-like protein